MSENLYPLTFVPVYKDYIWGGTRIPQIYRREKTTGICAESWEITDRSDGMSVVARGPHEGATLHEMVKALGPRLMGMKVKGARFPLLIKIIDARERLSVQVHPDDRTAAAVGGEAKTEVWYGLEGTGDAFVYAGLKTGVDRGAFMEALRHGVFENVLHHVPVRPGDAILVPGGRVHAIGEGCLLLEVQQNSNTTHRVYDWGRVDSHGHPRKTHLAEALQVINWNDTAPLRIPRRRISTSGGNRVDEVLSCPYFRLEHLRIAETMSCLNDGQSFHALFVVSGALGVTGQGFQEEAGNGVSMLIPAAISGYRLKPVKGPADVVRVFIPGA